MKKVLLAIDEDNIMGVFSSTKSVYNIISIDDPGTCNSDATQVGTDRGKFNH